MLAFDDQLADPGEPLNVILFGRQERIHPEMGEDFLHQITNVPDLELDGFVRPIWSDESAAPHFLNYKEQFGSIRVLADRKARSNLPAMPMSSTRLE
jgi:hypothetical protein